MSASRPIGYWLKHLHNLLEQQFDATLGDLGLGRRHWQVLNSLSHGETTREDLAAALTPFWTEGEQNLGTVLADLAAHDWTRSGPPPGGNPVALTDEGRAAHADIAARIDATRAVLLHGLTPEEYAEAVRILSVMAGNVEADLAAR